MAAARATPSEEPRFGGVLLRPQKFGLTPAEEALTLLVWNPFFINFEQTPTAQFRPGSAEHSAATAAIRHALSVADAPREYAPEERTFSGEGRCRWIFSFVDEPELNLLVRGNFRRRSQVGHLFVITWCGSEVIELWKPSADESAREFIIPRDARAELASAFTLIKRHFTGLLHSRIAQERALKAAAAGAVAAGVAGVGSGADVGTTAVAGVASVGSGDDVGTTAVAGVASVGSGADVGATAVAGVATVGSGADVGATAVAGVASVGSGADVGATAVTGVASA